MPQKHVNIPALNIDNTDIERVAEFNFLGITIHKRLKWDSHINKIDLKISAAAGVIYKLKNIFPNKFILTFYNILILPHIHHGILVRGYNLNQILLSSNIAHRTNFQTLKCITS